MFGSFGEPELRDRDWQAQSALGSSTYPDWRFASPDCRVRRGVRDHPMDGDLRPCSRIAPHCEMVAAVMKIEAGSLWAVARIEGVEAPDSWS